MQQILKEKGETQDCFCKQ